MKIEFVVEGSRGDAYTVSFEKKGANLNAYCTCPAGQSGQYCKHRIALMHGDVSSLLSENSTDVEQLKSMIRGTDVEAAYRKVLEATESFELAEAGLKKAKRDLARAMYK